MMYPRVRGTAAALMAAAVLASGCSTAPEGPPTGSTASQTTSDITTAPVDPDAAEAGPTGPEPSSYPTGTQPDGMTTDDTAGASRTRDALSLSGPVTAAAVPDVAAAPPATPRLPTTITDATGARITVTSADRIIALDLYGTLTDTIIALGLTDRLVGRGVSDTQAVIADLPVVSLGGIELNVEAVLEVAPDVILTNQTIGAARDFEQLEAAGVTVVRFDKVPSMAQIGDSVQQVAAVFGLTDQGRALAERIDAEMVQARATIDQLRRATPRAPRAIVLYLRGTAGLFFVFGPGYGVSDLIDALGLEDVAAEAGVSDFIPANAEALATLDPEIILTMTKALETAGGVPALLDRPGVAATSAGMDQRIIVADDDQLLSYGPRTPANLVALAEAIYTDGG